MTLLELIRTMEAAALQQSAIHTVVENDIFRLNTMPAAKYGVFAFTQGQHSASAAGDLAAYSFSLFYVDRLTADRDNQIEIQSTGTRVLRNILLILADEGIEVSEYTIQPFNQRFTDECAGVYCDVRFTVSSDTMCPDWLPPAPESIHGIPPGGSPGQVLTKTGPDDYAAGWEDPAGGELPDKAVTLPKLSDDVRGVLDAAVSTAADQDFSTAQQMQALANVGLRSFIVDASELPKRLTDEEDAYLKTCCAVVVENYPIAGCRLFLSRLSATASGGYFVSLQTSGTYYQVQHNAAIKQLTAPSLNNVLSTFYYVSYASDQGKNASSQRIARSNISAVGYLPLTASLGAEADGYPVALTSTLAEVQAAYALFWANPGRYRWSVTLWEGPAAAGASFIEEAEASAVMTAEGLQLEFRSQRAGKRYGVLLVVEDGAVTSTSVRNLPAEYLAATPSGDPMHYAYLDVAGVEYDAETGLWSYLADKGGLTDISTEEMRGAYALREDRMNRERLAFGYPHRFNISVYRGHIVSTAAAAFWTAYGLEVACMANNGTAVSINNMSSTFGYCTSLRRIIGTITAETTSTTNAFTQCPALEDVEVAGLRTSLSFANSSKLTADSILFAVSNAVTAAQGVVITLHSDAYARAMADERITAALSEHTNVTLASAEAVAATFARSRAAGDEDSAMGVEDGELLAPVGYYITQEADIDDEQRLYFARKTWNADEALINWRLASVEERDAWRVRLAAATAPVD